MKSDDFRLEIDEQDGALVMRGHVGWREPICPRCNEPIRWVLDMGSFSTSFEGEHVYCHARCLWTKEAFDRQKESAPDGE